MQGRLHQVTAEAAAAESGPHEARTGQGGDGLAAAGPASHGEPANAATAGAATAGAAGVATPADRGTAAGTGTAAPPGPDTALPGLDTALPGLDAAVPWEPEQAAPGAAHQGTGATTAGLTRAATADRGASRSALNAGPTTAALTPGVGRFPDPGERAGGATAVVAGMTTDPRMIWWIQRAVIAAVIGTVFALAVDWRLGLTLAALAASADAVYRARITAVIPATTRVSSAQRRTRWKLARLGPAGYFSLHARLLPGTGSAIDHLVVGPAGVYAVDSERWDRRLPVRTTHGGALFHGPFDQAEQLERVRWVASRASTLISGVLGQPVTVRPAMVIYGPTVPWIVVKIHDVDVFHGRRLRRYLRREASARGSQRLTERQIELIQSAAAQALPPAR